MNTPKPRWTLEELSKTVITFGKHAGKQFEEVPLNYLDWLIGQTWLRDPLKSRLEAYLSVPLVQRLADKELR